MNLYWCSSVMFEINPKIIEKNDLILKLTLKKGYRISSFKRRPFIKAASGKGKVK